ncbi:MAG: hypothetical protein KatS3mg014_0772 [Actinomycetota bacterium]|nr:MAG: hypothetical protein KatS3mg014_0772 [Actinomycetota bacterium]
MSCSTQHFISCRTFSVYGSWKSWITTMNARSERSFTASGRSIAQVAQAIRSAVDAVPASADALQSSSSAPRMAGSGRTRFVT